MIAFLFRNIFLKKDSWQSFLVMLFFIPERDFFLSRTKKQKKAASNALIFAFETAPFFNEARLRHTEMLPRASLHGNEVAASYERSECFISPQAMLHCYSWTDSNRHTVGDDLPGVPNKFVQTGRRGRRPLQFKIICKT